jgi:hypothetical protein
VNKLALALPCVAWLLTACAHPMLVKPDLEATKVVAQTHNPLPQKVGLYIPDSKRSLEVTTAGGGGDKVRYKPYADMETGIFQVLGTSFSDVVVLSSRTDTDAIAKHSLNYIVEPQIDTESSSSGVLTWMATDFKIKLTCTFSDPAGTVLATLTADGTGHSDFSELKHDMSAAGEHAATDALVKLGAAIQAAPEFRKHP